MDKRVCVFYIHANGLREVCKVRDGNATDLLALLGDNFDHVRCSHWHRLKSTGSEICIYRRHKAGPENSSVNEPLAEATGEDIFGDVIVAGHNSDGGMRNITRQEYVEYLKALADTDKDE